MKFKNHRNDVNYCFEMSFPGGKAVATTKQCIESNRNVLCIVMKLQYKVPTCTAQVTWTTIGAGVFKRLKYPEPVNARHTSASMN